jgi:hypothetical protein
MNDERLAAVIGDLLLAATFGLSLAFVLTYALCARWWQSPAGRNVMAFMASIAAVTGLGVTHLLYPGGHWFLWLRLAVFSTVPAIIAWRLWMLIRAQILAPADDLGEGDDNGSRS